MPTNVEGFGMIVLNISREEIELFDHTRVLEFLEDVKEKALLYEGKINFSITDYDEDQRELYEIDEVREYFDFLDRCFPYWFFFLIRTLPREHSPINLLISLLIPIKEISHKDPKIHSLEIDAQLLSRFIKIHFEFLNELSDEIGITDEENLRISKEVMNNISYIGVG